jgi:predicted PurR-regulated permease PerM/methylmalonyl-CoA mutase cobalamin-binding subunit
VANPSSAPSTRPLIVLGGVILVIAFLYWARAVLMPFALATLFAFILAPAVNALQRRGLGRIFSVVLVVFMALSLVGGIGYFIGDQLTGLLRRLPDYKEVIDAKVQSLNVQGSGVLNSVRNAINDVNASVKRANKDVAERGESTASPEDPRGTTPDKPLYTRQAGSAWDGLAGYAGPAAEGLADAVLVVVLVCFMLVQRESLRNRLVRMIGHGQLILTTRAIDEGARRVSRFLIMQLCTNAGFGLALTLTLVILSFFAATPEDAETMRRYAMLWGFVCGLMRFVPYLGTWFGAAMLVAFSVATLHGWTLPLVIFAVFVGLEMVCANAIEPVLFGHSTGSSPLALLLAAAFWAWLWGPVGLLLSTPLTVVVVVLGKYVPELRFFEVMLGDEPVLQPHVVLYQRLIARDEDEASELVEDYLKDRTPEQAYQDLFIPAMVQARQDLASGELDPSNARLLYQSVREQVDEIAPPATHPDRAAEGTVTILGCPARDEVDELALTMFAHLLRAHGRSVELVSSQALTAEILERVGQTSPGVVIIASVPPGGLAQTRYLCKRIRSQCPPIKIVVGRWGPQENVDQIKEKLKEAGADAVAKTLVDTRAEVVALLHVAEAAEAPQEAGVVLATSR